ncbi:MAG: flagellar motor protein MotD [Moraxellaceae bacterium]|nr:flagellar motor protein MotD [Moraxellaceae bacterium]MDZ4387041.1 flagellar motor protein MotD [Moraxellaceae bacterium]
MARKHKHEDHVNHEAWAIPYGDLVTLLLAFFVVMYAVSSVNEGKYRAASASLTAAFTGQPRTILPVQIGTLPVESSGESLQMDLVAPPDRDRSPEVAESLNSGGLDGAGTDLQLMAANIQEALSELIEAEVVIVRSNPYSLEVEIKTDLLFASGTASLSPRAADIIRRLAEPLQHFQNQIKVEGHTDNMPINTVTFPSNWELSAARAATVVHLLTKSGINSERLMVVGYGEHRPIASNGSAEGRNQNRRVLMIIMGSPLQRDETQLLPEQTPNRSGE